MNFNYKKKIIVTALGLSCIGITGLAGLAPQVQHAYATPKASQATLNKLASAQERYAQAISKLRELTGAAEKAQDDLYQTQQALDATRKEIEQTKVLIEQEKIKLKKSQKQLSDHIAHNYKAGSVSLLSVVLDAQSFNDFISRVHYMGKISDKESNLIAQVKQTRKELEDHQNTLKHREEEQVKLEEQQKAQKELADAATQEQKKVTDNLDADVKALIAKKRQEEAAAAERERREALARAQAAQNAYTKNGGKIAVQGAGGSHVKGKPSPSVVRNAMRYLGTPYVWGGSSGSGLDCSGLTSLAYSEAGISIPHSSAAQYALVKSRGHLTQDISKLVPGDLVFYYSPVHHVGIYIGGGKIVHAPTFGQSVRVDDVNVWGSFVGGGSL